MTIRPALRAIVISVLCTLLGATLWATSWGYLLDQRNGVLEGALPAVMILDLLAGLTAGIAAGPVRHSRVGNLILVIAASVSIWSAPAGIVAMVRIGMRRSYLWDGCVVAIMVVGTLVMEWIHPPEPGDSLALTLITLAAIAAVAVAALMWGRARGTRAALVTSLHQQALAAERERLATAQGRDAAVANARAEERTAIARDMHDSLSHQLSLIAMHAGALHYRDDLSPSQMKQAAETIHTSAREANSVLRDVLAALWDGSGDSASPLPTAASISELERSARELGQTVTVTWSGISPEDVQGATPTTATSLARICAELLLNARKHAPDAAVDMRIVHAAGRVTIRAKNARVRSAPPALGTGFGLIGAAERARLLGGTLTSGITTTGDYAVEVQIPWQT